MVYSGTEVVLVTFAQLPTLQLSQAVFETLHSYSSSTLYDIRLVANNSYTVATNSSWFI